MRVALICAHTCPLAALGGKETGGMNVYVRETSRELCRRGVEVDIFTRSQDPTVPRVVSLGRGARVFHVPAGPEAPYDKYRLMDHLPEFVEGILSAARRKYDLIHSHYWISGKIALELRRIWAAPVVHMYHTLGFIKNQVARSYTEQEREIRLKWEREVAIGADVLVAANPVERAQLSWHYDASPRKVRVIPCGVDPSLFHPMDRDAARDALGLEARAWLLFVGRLEPIKGLDTLLRALALLGSGAGVHPRPALMIVGGELNGAGAGGDSRGLREQIAALGLKDRVFLMGSKPQTDLPRFYAASEACILPSRYESFGMVALEAMACGTPVIASQVGGLNYTVRDGLTGFLVPEGDARAMADRIGRLVSNPPLRQRMGKAAMERAQVFRWGRVVDSILRVYGDLQAPLDWNAGYSQRSNEAMEEGVRK